MSEFDLTIDDEELNALYYSVNEAIRLWPGSPARPPEEQITLQRLQKCLFAMSLESIFFKPNEDESPSW
jgi:hypothetical protein